MENRKCNNSHERGVTVLFVISAFLVISFIGIILMKMSQHDSAASSDLSASTTAQHAARSGVLAASAYFSSNTAGTLEILNEYIEDVTAGNTSELTPWLFGGPSATVAIDQIHKYKVQLLAFTYNPTTTDNFSITVRSTGYGKGKSQTSIVSVIALDALEWNTVTTPGVSTPPTGGNENAIYFRGPHEINSKITLNGSAYFDDAVTFTAWANGSVFNKPFVVQGVAKFMNSFSATFNDVAYFIGKPQFEGGWSDQIRFNKKVGYENGSTPNVGYVGTTANATTLIYGDAVYNNGTGTPGNPIVDPYTGSPNNIPDLLGQTDRLPPTPPVLNETILATEGATVDTWPGNTTITANSLNTAFANAAGHLWNGYAVVKIPSGAIVQHAQNGGSFTGKIIIINEGKIWYTGNPNGWPNCADGSITVLINKGFLWWGQDPNANTVFRGYIFNTESGTDFFVGKDAGCAIDEIIGAVHDNKIWGAGNLMHYYGHTAAGNDQLTYSSAIINNIAALGLITGIGTGTAGEETPATETVTLVATASQQIIPTIISMQY